MTHVASLKFQVEEKSLEILYNVIQRQVCIILGGRAVGIVFRHLSLVLSYLESTGSTRDEEKFAR